MLFLNPKICRAEWNNLFGIIQTQFEVKDDLFSVVESLLGQTSRAPKSFGLTFAKSFLLIETIESTWTNLSANFVVINLQSRFKR